MQSLTLQICFFGSSKLSKIVSKADIESINGKLESLHWRKWRIWRYWNRSELGRLTLSDKSSKFASVLFLYKSWKPQMHFLWHRENPESDIAMVEEMVENRPNVEKIVEPEMWSELSPYFKGLQYHTGLLVRLETERGRLEVMRAWSDIKTHNVASRWNQSVSGEWSLSKVFSTFAAQ